MRQSSIMSASFIPRRGCRPPQVWAMAAERDSWASHSQLGPIRPTGFILPSGWTLPRRARPRSQGVISTSVPANSARLTGWLPNRRVFRREFSTSANTPLRSQKKLVEEMLRTTAQRRPLKRVHATQRSRRMVADDASPLTHPCHHARKDSKPKGLKITALEDDRPPGRDLERVHVADAHLQQLGVKIVRNS